MSTGLSSATRRDRLRDRDVLRAPVDGDGEHVDLRAQGLDLRRPSLAR